MTRTIRPAVSSSLVTLCAAVVVPAITGLCACTGESTGSRPALVDSGEDAAAVVDVDAPAANCSESGTAADCDPVDLTGCPEGAACYLLKELGTACACPGTTATGAQCSTTAECAPGNVCAGTSPPGTCRQICVPDDPQCPGGMKCTFITAYPEHGYCEPE